MKVIAIQGTDGVGASAAASAATRPPGVSLTTTQPQSLVFGVGYDSNPQGAPTNAVGAPGAGLIGAGAQPGDHRALGPAAHGRLLGAEHHLPDRRSRQPDPDRQHHQGSTEWNMVAIEVVAANNSDYAPS